MPTNYTPNYQLNQWEPEDQVLRADFNADNAKIDAALAAQAEALETEIQTRAVLSATVLKCGNCQIYYGSYTGDGNFGSSNPSKLTFSYPPVLVLIMDTATKHAIFVRNNTRPYVSESYTDVTATWSGNTLSWYSAGDNPQMNHTGSTYRWVALCSKS